MKFIFLKMNKVNTAIKLFNKYIKDRHLSRDCKYFNDSYENMKKKEDGFINLQYLQVHNDPQYINVNSSRGFRPQSNLETILPL